MMEIALSSIGEVSNRVIQKKDESWGQDISEILVDEHLAEGLVGLADFSHAVVLFYLDKAAFDEEKHLQRHPRNREDMPLVGIFSQRGKDRPNQIGMTTVEILSVTGNRLKVKGLDAVNGTPVLDIKPYYPIYDSRIEATVPKWVDSLMGNYF
jgi:tRNA (adenine37-N6)-methyltransferase